MINIKDWASQRTFWGVLNVFIVIMIIGAVFAIGVGLRSSNQIVSTRQIQVSGEGKVEIKPDVATISASVMTRGTDANKVQSESTTKMNSIIAFVKSQGVGEKDIKTTGYNLYPTNRWDPKSGEQIATGFEASQTITIKLRGIDQTTEKANAIAGGLVPAGANQVYGINYEIENPEAQREQARQIAFNNAFEKARSMAAQNHVRIARVITFTESPSYDRGPMPYLAMAKGGDSASVPAPDIQPGSEEVMVSVSVTYEIR
jgi:uncharacterized protein